MDKVFNIYTSSTFNYNINVSVPTPNSFKSKENAESLTAFSSFMYFMINIFSFTFY